MRQLSLIVPVFALAATLIVGCTSPKGETPEAKRQFILEQDQAVVAAAMKDKPVTQQEIDDAAGYATFTNIDTQVLLLGGDDGYGVLTNNETGERTYLDFDALEMGPGVGIGKYRLLLLFEDQETIREFLGGQWKWGAETAAIAKTGDGTGGSAEQTAAFDQGIKIWTVGDVGFGRPGRRHRLQRQADEGFELSRSPQRPSVEPRMPIRRLGTQRPSPRSRRVNTRGFRSRDGKTSAVASSSTEAAPPHPDVIPPQGLNRSTIHAPASTRYRNRSCSRDGRPCQNSHSSGVTRYPPQSGGTGTVSPPGYRPSSRANSASSTPRPGMTADWLEHHAPSCDARGRL